MDAMREELRLRVRSMYDFQDQRIALGNRLTGNIAARLGQEPGMKRTKIEQERQKLLKNMVLEYRRLADAIALEPQNRERIEAQAIQPQGVISRRAEYEVLGHYMSLLATEQMMLRQIDMALRTHPMYEWLMLAEPKNIPGCGILMSAVMLSELDIHLAETPSQFWAYAGLAVEADGRGTSRRKEHLVVRKYIDKNGEEKERIGIKFNPFLKTKLMGVLATTMITQKESRYRAIYDNYKHRIANMPAHQDKSDGHRDWMARRYMIKMMLVDFWRAWREVEGLPVVPSYSEGKLGMVHHG